MLLAFHILPSLLVRSTVATTLLPNRPASDTADRGNRNLNASVLRQITKALEHDASADLEAVLNKVSKSYAILRPSIPARHLKHRTGAYSGWLILFTSQ